MRERATIHLMRFRRRSVAALISAFALMAFGCSTITKTPNMSFICASCGAEHHDLPAIASAAPFHWSSEYANDTNSLLTSDLCIIEGRDYFIRGVIQIPIHDYEDTFDWGVWVTQKKENFELYREHFNDGVQIGPFFGWLSTKIDYYSEDTLNLKTRAHFSTNGTRPLIELEPTDHPLAIHQREGITLAEAWKILHSYDKK
jgi:hypothetical protein